MISVHVVNLRINALIESTLSIVRASTCVIAALAPLSSRIFSNNGDRDEIDDRTLKVRRVGLSRRM